MAIVKATYTKSRPGAKAALRYIQHRPGREGEKVFENREAVSKTLVFEALLIKQKPPETGDNNFSSLFSNPVYAQNRLG